MGKISNYTRALVAKLQDVFVVDQTDNNVTTTKSVTVEQIGDTIAGTQVHSDLKTDSQTIIGGINELAKDKNVADEYDDTHTYNTGDVCIYNNVLYICTEDNITGTFDPSKWTATTIDNVIGSLSTLTTTVKSSLVGAVNEVNGKFSGYVMKEYTDTMPTSISNKVVQVDSGVAFAHLIGASVYNSGATRFESLTIGTETTTPDLAHINMLKNDNGVLSLRLFIDGATGLSAFNGATVKAICLVKYS